MKVCVLGGGGGGGSIAFFQKGLYQMKENRLLVIEYENNFNFDACTQ